MGDLVFVATVIVFFAVAVAYVRGCERIVGGDDVVRASDGAGGSAGPDVAGGAGDGINQ